MSVRVAVGLNTPTNLTNRLVHAVSDAVPQARLTLIHVCSEDSVQQVREGNIDLALFSHDETRPASYAGLNVEPIAPITLTLWASDDIHEAVRAQDWPVLREATWICPVCRPCQAAAEGLFKRFGETPARRIRVDRHDLARLLVRHPATVAILPDSLGESLPEALQSNRANLPTGAHMMLACRQDGAPMIKLLPKVVSALKDWIRAAV
ncbi:MAG: LysR substrate-binding domain-containing protein [Asticcacaulis sp.]